jgi:hypothetical protein
MQCNHLTGDDFMGIAPIEPVLSKIAVTVAFFFEDSAGGPYKPDEKALSPPISTNLFQTLMASARESIHANTEICGAPAHDSAGARDCRRGMRCSQSASGAITSQPVLGGRHHQYCRF